MRSRRSQPPPAPGVRTLVSRRENGGDLSWNNAHAFVPQLSLSPSPRPSPQRGEGAKNSFVLPVPGRVRFRSTPLSPALIAPGFDPTQAGWSCREQRKRAIVGNGSRTTPNVWVIAGGFTALAAMSSPAPGVVRGNGVISPDTFTVRGSDRDNPLRG
ncbi:Uncharacterised protein [Cedecea davisae]|nr:Uncharacterised protein [Cedecea davisae]